MLVQVQVDSPRQAWSAKPTPSPALHIASMA